MHKPRPRTNIIKQSLRYRANSCWNSLPNTMKKYVSPHLFKKES